MTGERSAQADLLGPYVPITCSIHDELLAAATLRGECDLVVRDADGEDMELRGVIEDVYSRDKAEYLRLRGGQTYRLDTIVAFNGKPVTPA